MHEFELIELIQNSQSEYNNKKSDYINFGIGDDCASLNIPNDHELLISTDTLVDGIHFDQKLTAQEIGHKSLAVNLSDIAAMGAMPIAATLNLTLPSIDETWLSNFLQGFLSLAKEHNVFLIGGDTTKGHLSISVTINGIVKQGQAIKRSGANAKDKIFVTGPLGEAAFILQSEPAEKTALHKPLPHNALGLKLQGIANAMIDISDGLSSDLQHLLKSSNKGAIIDAKKIPIGKQLQAYKSQDEALSLALHGGEDYVLCFTVSNENLHKVKTLQEQFNHITEIGIITESNAFLLDKEGEINMIKATGYNHFNEQ